MIYSPRTPPSTKTTTFIEVDDTIDIVLEDGHEFKDLKVTGFGKNYITCVSHNNVHNFTWQEIATTTLK